MRSGGICWGRRVQNFSMRSNGGTRFFLRLCLFDTERGTRIFFPFFRRGTRIVFHFRKGGPVFFTTVKGGDQKKLAMARKLPWPKHFSSPWPVDTTKLGSILSLGHWSQGTIEGQTTIYCIYLSLEKALSRNNMVEVKTTCLR